MIIQKKQWVMEGTNVASIDIGSHTARMLIGQYTGSGDLFRPITRERAYIRLAEGFRDQKGVSIGKEAILRTIKTLNHFLHTIKENRVEAIYAVATGVVRKAINSNKFVEEIYESTGVRVEIISGEKEALFTRLGSLHCLGLEESNSLIFDLGGGTTEFIINNVNKEIIKSLPIGAVTLTQTFFSSDPPEKDEMESLRHYVLETLEREFSQDIFTKDKLLIIGAGGTVTSLGAMINNIPVEDINPSRVNGLELKRTQTDDLLNNLKEMSYEKRKEQTGLDQGRAGVIVAGTLAVTGILDFFKLDSMTVSYSDILEGIIIDFFHKETPEGSQVFSQG